MFTQCDNNFAFKKCQGRDKISNSASFAALSVMTTFVHCVLNYE